MDEATTPEQERKLAAAVIPGRRPDEENGEAPETSGMLGGPKPKITSLAPPIDKARAGAPMNDQEITDATAYFLAADPVKEDEEEATRTFEINLGGDDLRADRWISWKVKSIERERIQQIRRLATPAAARAGRSNVDSTPDEMKVAAMIAAEATVEPDLQAIAVKWGTPNLTTALTTMLKRKPGLVDQISGQVLNLSGYSDDDVRDPSQPGA